MQLRVADERQFVLDKDTAEVSPILIPHTNGGDPLTFHLRLIDADGNVIHDDDHVVFNPPTQVVTGMVDGVPVVVEDHRAAFRGIVKNIADMVLGK